MEAHLDQSPYLQPPGKVRHLDLLRVRLACRNGPTSQINRADQIDRNFSHLPPVQFLFGSRTSMHPAKTLKEQSGFSLLLASGSATYQTNDFTFFILNLHDNSDALPRRQRSF